MSFTFNGDRFRVLDSNSGGFDIVPVSFTYRLGANGPQRPDTRDQSKDIHVTTKCMENIKNILSPRHLWSPPMVHLYRSHNSISLSYKLTSDQKSNIFA